MFGLADVLPSEGNKSLNEKVERIEQDFRFSGVDGAELSRAVIRAHEKMFEDIMRRRAEDETVVPVTMSGIPLIRMSRRLAGAYTLDDTETHVVRKDSIGMTGDWRRRGSRL
jgi:hypothetical protein